MPSALCTKLRAVLAAAFIASLLLSPAATPIARAQQPARTAGLALVVTPAANQTQVQWRAPTADVEPASAAATHLPLLPYAGAMLPMQTLVVRVEGDIAPAALPSHLVDAPWTGPLPAVDAPAAARPRLGAAPLASAARRRAVAQGAALPAA